MPTLASIHAFIAQCCPQIHAARRRVLFAVVAGALRGGALSLTSLRRALAGAAYAKHKIKRVDRLLGTETLLPTSAPGKNYSLHLV